MAKTVTVIYATESKTVRRIAVSDDSHAVGMINGESSITIPYDDYSKMNPAELDAHIVKTIGAPAHDCKCIEVDKNGVVIHSIMADPDLDKPLMSKDNTIQLGVADAGEVGTPSGLSGTDGKLLGLPTKKIPLWTFGAAR